MKNILAVCFALFTVHTNAQVYCLPDRFDSTPSFTEDELTIITNRVYGKNVDWKGDSVTLYMDIYYPGFESDNLEMRPLLVFLPGGGYIVGDKEYFAAEAIELAKRGFVCASIDYRTGWQANGTPINCNGEGLSLIKANYRASQDIHASLRYLTYHAEMFKIDPDFIYLVGSSAGSIAGLMTSFMTSSQIDELYPDANLQDELGTLDTATNKLEANFALAGMVSLWGGLPDVSFITSENVIPLLFMHGVLDDIVPYEAGYLYSCDKYFQLEGSSPLADHLMDLGACFELNIDTDGDHGVYTQAYRIERMYKFIKEQLCGDCSQKTIVNQEDLILSSKDLIPEISIYPNPTRDVVNIDGLANYQNLEFKLTNIVGTTLLQNKRSSESTSQIRIGHLHPGMYVLTIYVNGKHLHSKKIIKN